MSTNELVKKVSKNIKNKLFLIITSVQTIIMGFLFIIQVLRIYVGNEGKFTREICKDYIIQILPAIILWILLIIASFIYYYIKGNPKEKIAKLSNINKLTNLENICPKQSQLDESLDSASLESLDSEYRLLNKEKKNRKTAFIATLVIIIISSVMGLLYLVNPNHFDSTGDVTKQIGSMSIYLLPWVIISFGSLIAYSIYEEYSSKKSIESIKKIITISKQKQAKAIKQENKTISKKVIQIAVLVIAIGLIVVGLINDGDKSVLQKAITICNECIGLG